MNRIDTLFSNKKKDILSVYFTAGYPSKNSTAEIIKQLASGGADMIEIGVPFSDPIADGPVIQHSNSIALKNGMNMILLFSQLQNVRKNIDIPLIIMSYCNPLLSFGMENFCRTCMETGIDGAIIPDLPPDIYIREYKAIFSQYGLRNIMMVSPQTDDKRIRKIDRLSTGFIYMVSSSSTTGIRKGFTGEQTEYFKRVKEMKLNNPLLIGFGISDHQSYKTACTYASGAIVGSGFIRMLDRWKTRGSSIRDFIKGLREDQTDGILNTGKS